jgi:GT2 family glycosyltransferase
VIVNWNSGTHLCRCIDSLAAASQDVFPPPRPILIDNGSTDGSLEGIDRSRLSLTLIRNKTNRGFAAGCNQGAKTGDAEYILFLNPDVRLARDSLRVPLAFMQRPQNARHGICGIQLIDDHGNINPNCARFPSWQHLAARSLALDRLLPARFPAHYLSESEHRRTQEVDQVSGAFFLVRRRLFEQLAGFDERFFVYFEELDFSVRARRAGFSSAFLAGTRAVHHGSGSAEQVPVRRLYYWWRSRTHYCWKHFDTRGAVAVLLVTLLIEPISRLAWACVRRSGRDAVATVVASLRFWTGLPELLKIIASLEVSDRDTVLRVKPRGQS